MVSQLQKYIQFFRHRDIQLNYTLHNGIEHNNIKKQDTKPKCTWRNTHGHYAEGLCDGCRIFYCYAECRYVECRFAECLGAVFHIQIASDLGVPFFGGNEEGCIIEKKCFFFLNFSFD
jgi:hypothetical protein